MNVTTQVFSVDVNDSSEVMEVILSCSQLSVFVMDQCEKREKM